jgi:hypothetical protein
MVQAPRVRPGVLHQVLVLQHARHAHPRQAASQRRPQTEPTSQPRHRGRQAADVDAVPLRGLHALDDPDGPDSRRRAGPSGTDPVPAAGKPERENDAATDGRQVSGLA